MIKVEPDSNSDTHQLPSCGETEQKQDPVLSAVKSEDLVSCIHRSRHISQQNTNYCKWFLLHPPNNYTHIEVT
jgi:hypothetical protein